MDKGVLPSSARSGRAAWWRMILIALMPLMALTVLLACASLSLHTHAAVTLNGKSTAVRLDGEIESLIDTSGTLTIKDIQREDVRWQSTERADLAFGYQPGAVWLRIKLQQPTSAPYDWRIEIGYAPIQSLTLYVPSIGMRQYGGAGVPFAERPFPNRNHVFPVTLPPGSHTVYLRAMSASSTTLPLRIADAESFERSATRTYLFLGLYYGLLFALGAYNLLLFIALRSAPFGWYVLWVFALGSVVAHMNGVGSEFLWPAVGPSGGPMLPISTFASNTLAILFSRSLLESRLHFPRFDKVLVVVSIISFVQLLSAPLIPTQFAYQLMSLSSIFVVALLVWLAVISVLRGVSSAKYYLAAWLVLLIGALMVAMRNFGLLPNTFFALYGVQIGSALEMVLLSLALANRFAELKRDKEAAQATALAVLRRSEQQLEERVNARTEELGRANARLAESEARLRELAHHDALTGLPNRLRLDQHLEGALARAKRVGQPSAVLVIDLDGFKAVNDQHGHDVGDRLLTEVAQRFRNVVRASDFIARIGGDEFVVVLEAPQQEASALLIAQKLVDALDRELSIDGKSLRVGASVGIALSLPGQDESSGATIIRWADAAMYQAKGAGRNCVRLRADVDAGLSAKD